MGKTNFMNHIVSLLIEDSWDFSFSFYPTFLFTATSIYACEIHKRMFLELLGVSIILCTTRKGEIPTGKSPTATTTFRGLIQHLLLASPLPDSMMSSLVTSTEHHKTFYIVVAFLVIIIIMLILYRKWGVPLKSKLGISQKVTAESECDEIKCVDIRSHTLNYCPNYYPIRTYSLEELKKATKDFKILLGSGATSDVYLAEFGDGKFAAVKRLIEKKGGTLKFFFDEVSVLLRISHPNLVGLLGFCLEKGEQLLLLEYIQHKSLFDKMHTRNGQESGVLSWSDRISIALDIAQALDYLHSMADPPIIHRDVKSSNILLISNDHAKLADFGLCKLGNDIQGALTPTTVKGSHGYVDTYYLKTGLVSPKSDVYSFGVLLLELITGLRSVQGSTTLAEWTEDCRKNKSIEKWMGLLDPKLNGDVNLEQLNVLVSLANQALLANYEERPEVSQIVYRLSSCLESLPESQLPV